MMHGRSLSDPSSAIIPVSSVEDAEVRSGLVRSASRSSSQLDNNYDCEYKALIEEKTPHLDKKGDIKIDFTGIYLGTESSLSRFPQERIKTLISLIFLVLAGLSNDFVLAYIHELVPSTPPLPDIFFTYTPYIPWALVLSEYFILTITVIAFTTAFLHKYRWIVVRRIFFIAGLLYLGRCVSMLVTQVPVADPKYYCSPKLNNRTFSIIFGRAVALVSGLGLKINGKHTLCGDYIYSGHTTVLVLTYLIVKEYSPRRCWYLHWLCWFLSGSGMISLLLSRGHYTVDVIIAYWVTTRLFWFYHTMANNSELKEYSSNNLMSRVCWFPLFRFMEGNVDGPLPRKYEWPLPWPKFLRRTSTKSNLH